MKKERRNRNLQQTYSFYNRIPAIILLVGLLVWIAFASLYVFTSHIVFLIILIVVSAVGFTVYSFFYNYAINYFLISSFKALITK